MAARMLCAAVLLASWAGAGPAAVRAEEVRWHPLANKPGCSVWNSDPQPGESATWSGACVAGKGEGPGTLIWRYRQDGRAVEAKAMGTLRAGRFHGRYAYTSPDGTRFDGDDNGRGIITWASGDRYEGNFRDGKRHGQGIRTWPSGARYEGRFVADKADGIGACRSAGGRRGRCLYENDQFVRWLD